MGAAVVVDVVVAAAVEDEIGYAAVGVDAGVAVTFVAAVEVAEAFGVVAAFVMDGPMSVVDIHHAVASETVEEHRCHCCWLRAMAYVPVTGDEDAVA